MKFKKKVIIILLIVCLIMMFIMSRFIAVGDIAKIENGHYILEVKNAEYFILTNATEIIVNSKRTAEFNEGDRVMVYCKNGVEESLPPIVTAKIEIQIK